MAPLAVILPAAGRSARFGGGRNKLLEPLAGRPVVAHTFEAFARRPDVVAVIIAAADLAPLRQAIGESHRAIYCAGGETRAHSVRNALDCVPPGVEWVAVHDAARPLVSQELVSRTFAAAVEHGSCAVPAMPVALTVKQAAGPLPARVQRTVPRHDLWAMQTPQVMRRDDLLAAYDACPLPLEQVTDDAQLIELAGGEVWLVPGEERNLKITTALDLRVAELLLSE